MNKKTNGKILQTDRSGELEIMHKKYFAVINLYFPTFQLQLAASFMYFFMLNMKTLLFYHCPFTISCHYLIEFPSNTLLPRYPARQQQSQLSVSSSSNSNRGQFIFLITKITENRLMRSISKAININGTLCTKVSKLATIQRLGWFRNIDIEAVKLVLQPIKK